MYSYKTNSHDEYAGHYIFVRQCHFDGIHYTLRLAYTSIHRINFRLFTRQALTTAAQLNIWSKMEKKASIKKDINAYCNQCSMTNSYSSNNIMSNKHTY